VAAKLPKAILQPPQFCLPTGRQNDEKEEKEPDG